MKTSKFNPKNIDAMPPHLIAIILNSPNCTGDARNKVNDYGPVKEELEQALWKHQAQQDEKALKEFEREQKEYFKYLATSHKRRKLA